MFTIIDRDEIVDSVEAIRPVRPSESILDQRCALDGTVMPIATPTSALFRAGAKLPPPAPSPQIPVRGDLHETVKREDPGIPVPARGPPIRKRTLSFDMGSTSGDTRSRNSLAAIPLPPMYFRTTSSSTVVVEIFPELRSMSKIFPVWVGMCLSFCECL